MLQASPHISAWVQAGSVDAVPARIHASGNATHDASSVDVAPTDVSHVMRITRPDAAPTALHSITHIASRPDAPSVKTP